MEKEIPNDVNDFLKWKNGKKFTKIKSVEDLNSEYVNKCGGSNRVDVLYSFLGIYAIGVYVYNKDKINMFKITNKTRVSSKNNGKYDQVLASRKFLIELQDNNDIQLEVKNLNEIMSPFVKKYFKAGNIIPLWPGGNILKGNQNNGFMDIPELFFSRFYDWYEVLKDDQYAFLTEFDNQLKKYKKSTTKNLESFVNEIGSIESYNSYINNINLIIDIRTKEIENVISKLM